MSERKISAAHLTNHLCVQPKRALFFLSPPPFYVVYYGPTMPHELCSMYNKISEFFVLIVLLWAARTSKNLSCMPVSYCSTLHTVAIFIHPVIDLYAKVTCLRKQWQHCRVSKDVTLTRRQMFHHWCTGDAHWSKYTRTNAHINTYTDATHVQLRRITA